MHHDWIFDVLSDLKAYALNNSLPALASKVDEALDVARAEIKADGEGPASGSAPPSSGRPH